MKSYIRPDSFNEFIEAYNDHINKDSVRNNNGLKSYFILLSLLCWVLMYVFTIVNIYFFCFSIIISIISLLMKYRRIE